MSKEPLLLTHFGADSESEKGSTAESVGSRLSRMESVKSPIKRGQSPAPAIWMNRPPSSQNLVALHSTVSASPDKSYKKEPPSPGPSQKGGLRFTKETPQSLYLHVAMEYTIPFAEYVAIYGGLGKIVDTIFEHCKEPMALICPMYGDFPLKKAKEAKGWVYSLNEFYIQPAHTTHEITIHSFSKELRTYLLISCELFSSYKAAQIYQWCRNAMEIIFLSVFNQSIAHILATQIFRTVHFHDYHGCLSLLYDLPYGDRTPARRALMTVHNGDCQGSWACVDRAQMDFLQQSFCLQREVFEEFCMANGTMNMLGAFVKYCLRYQNGIGVSTISLRHAARIKKKHSLFWSLKEINVIPNGVDENEIGQDILEVKGSPEKLRAMKSENKKTVQQRYGLEVDPNKRLLSFMGRLAYQKGCDLIAGIIDELASIPDVQIIIVGPHNDAWGEYVAQKFHESINGRLRNAHFCPYPVRGREREELMRATDFCLMPSRFEPFGLVDIEFGWRGALTIGSDVDGLGKMPGFYFPLDNVFTSRHQKAFIEEARRALATSPITLQYYQEMAILRRFPVEEMLASYERYAASVNLESDRFEKFEQVLKDHLRVERFAADVRQNLFGGVEDKRKGQPEPLNLDQSYGAMERSHSPTTSERDDDEGSVIDPTEVPGSGDLPKKKRVRRNSMPELGKGGIYVVNVKTPSGLRAAVLEEEGFDRGVVGNTPNSVDINASVFSRIYIRRATLLWPGLMNPWRPLGRGEKDAPTPPRHLLFYWMTWALYITSSIPSAILFSDASVDINNSKNGTFIALLFATYGLGFAIGSIFWGRYTFEFPPRVMLTAAAFCNMSVVLTIIRPSPNVTLFLLGVTALLSSFSGPVCLGLNYLAESPDKEVSVGIRSGIGDCFRFAVAGGLALSFLSAGEGSDLRRILHATIIVCMVIGSFVMMVIFWFAAPSQYNSYVLPRDRQINLFFLRRVPLFVFINGAFDCIGLLTVAIAGANFLLNMGWSVNDWLTMFFCSLIATGTSSIVAGFLIHRAETTISSYSNPLNLLYMPASFALKAMVLGLCYRSSVATVVVLMSFCDFFGHMRNLSINYTMVTALHRELFVIGTALRATVEGSLNFIAGMILSVTLEYADEFIQNPNGLVLSVAMVGVMVGGFQWVIGLLLFGYYEKERLNLP